MKTNEPIWSKLIFIISIMTISCASWSCAPVPQAIPRPPVINSHDPSVTSLWVRKEYFISFSDHSQMIASENKLYIIGSASTTDLPHLLALDSHNGDIIWQYDDTDANVLIAWETMIIVGEVGRVTAFDSVTGAIIWSTNLPLTRSVTKVLVRDDVLYVDTVSSNHFILDVKTGKILQTIAYTINNEPNSAIPIWSDQNMNLEFVGNIMYFQKQTGYPEYRGNIVALDEGSTNQIWNSKELFAVCRMATSPLGIFVLNTDGELLRFDPVSGIKNEIIQFTHPPILSSEAENGGYWVYEYSVAVDSENQLGFVYFGDSMQLFAFQISVSR